MEVHLAGLERCGEGLGIHIRDHQDPTVMDVLGADRDKTVRRETDRRDVEWRTHATAAGTNRTGRPAAAIAAFTSAIAWILRWKIDPASTAPAPPSSIAATKSAGPAAPPEAMTGTRTRD